MEDGVNEHLPLDIYGCFLDLVAASGARIEEAVIDECRNNVYRATLTVSGDRYRKKLRMWAGDAMVLAHGSGAPVFILRPLLEGWVGQMAFDDSEKEALKRWLDEVKPSSFST